MVYFQMEKADQSEKISEETKERIDKVTSSINDIQPELDEFVNKTTDFIAESANSMQDFDAARNQIAQVPYDSM